MTKFDHERPRKWFKKDIRELQSHLHSAYVIHRPLDFQQWPKFDASFTIAIKFPGKRKDLVLDGIRSARARMAERYRQACEAIGNALVRKVYGDSTPDFIDRFVKDAKELDAEEKRQEKLLHRVLEEGLPPEVEAYDPIKKQVETAASPTT